MDSKTSKTAEENQREYATLLRRKQWLLLQNPNFMEELRHVSNLVGYAPAIRGVIPFEAALDWRFIGKMAEKVEGVQFLRKYGLYKRNEADKTRLLDIGQLGDLREEAQRGKWHLESRNFERDKNWYELHVLGTYYWLPLGHPKRDVTQLSYRQIAENEDQRFPVTLDRLFLRNLKKLRIENEEKEEIAKDKIELLDKVDPKKRYRTSEFEDELLYELGILKIGIAEDDFGYQARGDRYIAIKKSDEGVILRGHRYYLRYDQKCDLWEMPEKEKKKRRIKKSKQEKWGFKISRDEQYRLEKKGPLREEFIKGRDDYVYGRESAESDYDKLMSTAVDRMKQKIKGCSPDLTY